MRWVVALGGIVVFVGALGLGAWLGRPRGEGEDEEPRGKRAATITIALCLGVILLRLALSPAREFALIGWEDYALIRPWWPIPFALALLAAGSWHMRTPNARKLVLAFAVLLSGVTAHKMIATARFDPAEVTGRVGPDGVCLQTTDYTCGAAAAAELLGHLGVETDERDMAVRCWTNALTGTDEFCVARGLRQKLAGTGRVVRVQAPSFAELAAREEPGMATIQWSTFVDHWVVVRGVDARGVILGDPLRGKVVLSEAEFKAVWRGGLVTADRP
ncbi:MAG: cysteine peptidase family C39 domain-containing protein [Planctomycetota bacterium]